MSYKRSQIEDAICQSRDAKGKARTKVLMRIKRLLASDRDIPTKAQRRGHPKAHYAFFSEAAPGKGAEVEFTNYEAFALDLALYFLDQGLPHRDTAELLRLLRSQLEPVHKSVISRPIENAIPVDLLRTDGQAVLVASDPVFVIVGRVASNSLASTSDGFSATIVTSGGGWLDHLWASRGRVLTTVEITLTARFLEQALQEISPRNRGRN